MTVTYKMPGNQEKQAMMPANNGSYLHKCQRTRRIKP
jgi:hypothetical protein